LERGERPGRDTDMPDTESLSEQLRDFGDLRFRPRDGSPHAFDFKFNEESPAVMALSWSGRGRLGITYTEIEGQLADYFKAPKDVAILVNSVGEGSAAEKAGIKAGDLLLKLGATTVEGASDLQEAVRDLEPGKPSPVTVLREGRNVELSVTVSEEGTKGPPLRRHRPVS
jgi:S1-C subfamily serine protease